MFVAGCELIPQPGALYLFQRIQCRYQFITGLDIAIFPQFQLGAGAAITVFDENTVIAATVGREGRDQGLTKPAIRSAYGDRNT